MGWKRNSLGNLVPTQFIHHYSKCEESIHAPMWQIFFLSNFLEKKKLSIFSLHFHNIFVRTNRIVSLQMCISSICIRKQYRFFLVYLFRITLRLLNDIFLQHVWKWKRIYIFFYFFVFQANAFQKSWKANKKPGWDMLFYLGNNSEKNVQQIMTETNSINITQF
jgi:hypothetical protein